MKVFWLRLMIFSFLWTYEIIMNSTYMPLSLIFFAATLGVYFSLTIPKLLLWKYTAILLFLTAHGYFFTSGIHMTIILILYIVIEAGFRLSTRKLPALFMIAGLFIISVSFGNEVRLESGVLYIFIGFLVFKLNEMAVERNEQREIYNELLGEYRMLKRLHITAEDNARLEERTRIARDIHDSVGHRLTALIMKLEMLKIEDRNPAYDDLQKMATESLEETRSAVKTLQTEESEGISTVIHMIRKLEAESHLLVQFTLKQGVLSVPITNEMSVVLYRVIQEALTNIMRHGETRDAQIVLGRTAADDIVFEISNPIHQRKPFTMGFGLKNMKMRVEEINGSLQVYQTGDRFIVSGKITKGEK